MKDFYSCTPQEQAPRMQALARAALRHWDLADAELSLIKMRENAVFRVSGKDGDRFVVRIHRHGYHSDAELRSELQWMRALQESGIHVPPVVPSTNGALFVEASAPGVPEPRQVDVFGWVNGEPLGSSGGELAQDAATLRGVFRTIGELTARMHAQASAWSPPAGFTRHAWDTEGLVGETPFWGRFWELAALSGDQRALLERARARVRDELAALDRDPRHYSLIHADFTPENLLLDGDTVRPIDFDDAGWGWHLFDIATTLIFHLDTDHYGEILAAFLEGYRSRRALPDSQLRHLPLFMLARSFTYLGWVHTRSETETARELTPMLVELSTGLAADYLA